MIKVDISEVQIQITKAAIDEIALISKNDFTVEGLTFRLKIDGKGCNGFDYATGFTEKQEDDLTYTYTLGEDSISILLDKFTAFYSKEGTLDYLKDYQNNTEQKFSYKDRSSTFCQIKARRY